MKKWLLSSVRILFFCAIGSIMVLSPATAKAETYCLSADLCFTIPGGFLLVDKALSDEIANSMKKRFPGENIGFYAGLYETFYQNKLMRVERAYIAPIETGNLFVVFYKMNSQQKGCFPKESFTKGHWPSKGMAKDRLQQSLTEGMKKSKGLSQGGMSMDLLEFSSLGKYMLMKRTLDSTEERLDQTKQAGIPVGQPKKVGTDFIAVRFGQKDGAILMYFVDSTERPENYLNIFGNMLSNSTD
ncbi:MAG: hypothetical protein NT047_02145 [Deltaproteobacteria bacterium]|nr:hypothetical protein [Deltaproteobacteria bacterium]